MNAFFSGIAAGGALAVGLYFLRLWRETRDRFFVLFGAAFWLLALNWGVLVWVAPESEHRHYFYLFRLAAFLLIILAIVDKNRAADGP